MKESKAEYLEYVKSVLDGLPKGEAVVSYDTGYGLHIVNEHLGDQPMTLFVVQSSLAKVRTPNIDGEAWFDAWREGCDLVRETLEAKS